MSAKLPMAAVGAWLLVAVYYFYQYALRSAPSVMMPQLTEAFGVNCPGGLRDRGHVLLRLLPLQPRRWRGH